MRHIMRMDFFINEPVGRSHGVTFSSRAGAAAPNEIRGEYTHSTLQEIDSAPPKYTICNRFRASTRPSRSCAIVTSPPGRSTKYCD